MSERRPETADQAVVLIGGGSTRMGRDKAMIPRENVPNAVFLTQLLRPYSRRVPLWQGRPSSSLEQQRALLVPDVTWLPDAGTPGQGPLAGLASLVSASDAADFLVLAVDLFWCRPKAVAWLLAQRGNRAAVRPHLPGRPFGEPLCAWYRRDVLCDMVRRFEAGERGVNRAFALGASCDVSVPEALVPFFGNANVPDALPDPLL